MLTATSHAVAHTQGPHCSCCCAPEREQGMHESSSSQMPCPTPWRRCRPRRSGRTAAAAAPLNSGDMWLKLMRFLELD